MRTRQAKFSVWALAAALVLSGSAAAGSAQDVSPTAAPAAETRRVRPLSPARIDDTLVIDGQAIDANKLRSRMTVPVRINGTGPYRFVVDSGADSSVVGTQVTAALNLELSGSVLVNGMTNSALVPQARIDSLDLGTTGLKDLYLPVLQEAHIGADGMIGLDALVNQRLVLDFEKRVILVDDARTKPPRFDGEIVVRAKLRRGQLILTEGRARDVPIDIVVDTGSEVTIGNSALRERIFPRGAKVRFTGEVTGATGATANLDIAIVPELRIGSVILRDVPIAFADVRPFQVFGLSSKPALLLGTDLMENFRKVSLDFGARKVRFQLKRCESSVARFNSSNGVIGISTSGAARAACSR